MMNEFNSYNEDNCIIDRIEIRILGNNEKRKISVLDEQGVTGLELYKNGEPEKGSLVDLRMGPSTNDLNCATCGKNMTYCEGHFGHIPLPSPIFRVEADSTIIKILQCICTRCSKLLLNKNNHELIEIIKSKPRSERLKAVKDAIKNVSHCKEHNYGCGAIVPKIREDKGVIYVEMDIDGDEKRKIRQILKDDVIYNILKNISKDDAEILGIHPDNNPEDLVLTVLPVPPVQIRPSTRGDYLAGMLLEDDLTHGLANIVKAVQRIIKNKESLNENNINSNEDYHNLLSRYITAYIEDDKLASASQKDKKIKSLADRLKGKHGRIRGNMMGKRVDFTARTVITSDPTIGNNELGVPVKIAMNLTFPEIVTPWNIEELTKLVRNGSDKYPGANFVFKKNSHLPIILKYRKEGIDLRYGDIVERHLRTGDIVLLNRQPTLHKQSMMGHKIKVIDNPALETFRLSVSVTTPYNADFDGDEMNIFCAQSYQTMVELEEIAAVERQLITPTTSRTIIGIVQDGLLGAYNLTDSDTLIDWRTYMNLLSYTSVVNNTTNKPDALNVKKGVSYPGTMLYSTIIPINVNMTRPNFRISQGQLVEGQLNKSLLGAGVKSNLIQQIWDDNGLDAATNFINDNQRLINNFNLWNGFSVGFGDTVLSEEIQNEILEMFKTHYLKVEHFITENENRPDMLSIEAYTNEIRSKLDGIRSSVSELIINNVSKTNAFRVMAKSGSKGNQDNLAQMVGCLGLLTFDNGLIPKVYNRRTLAYFHQDDDRAPSRGFIPRAFVKGTQFPEMVIVLMTGRLGLIEQQLKTADTGYTQRRLIKSLEDIMIKYDGTVRNANNSLIQLVYGDSGADTTKQYEYEIRLLTQNNKDIQKNYCFSDKELSSYKKFSKKDNERLYNMLINIRDDLRNSLIRAKMSYNVAITKFMIPVNINRIVEMRTNDKGEALTPDYVMSRIEELFDNSKTTLMTMASKSKNTFKLKDEAAVKTVFRAAIYDAFNPKRVIIEYGVNKKQFDRMVEQIILGFKKNIAEPGEMVGIIAAQSAGEPLTQFTLNSFHHAGIAGLSDQVGGVPRMKELLSVSKNPKMPKMFIYLDEESRDKKEIVNKISSYIKNTTIEHIRGKIDVYYDPEPEVSMIMKRDNVKNVFYHNGTSRNIELTNLPWLIRVELIREKLMENEVSLLDIKGKFSDWWDRHFTETKNLDREKRNVLNKITHMAVLSNTDNDLEPVIHIRFNVKDTEDSKFNLQTINSFIDNVIDKFKLKGIDNINDVTSIINPEIITYDEDGTMVKKKEYVISTDGVNMRDIRYLTGIDLNRTITNHVVEAYELFGIEIARSVLLKEITKSYELAGASGLNYQHFELIVDQMTYTGMINSIDRHGMGRSENDPLARISFEQVVDQIVKASIFGEDDKMRNVSSRIMAGMTIRGGTGYCDLLFNTDMVEQSEYIEGQDYTQTHTKIVGDTVADDIIKKKDTDNVFIPF